MANGASILVAVNLLSRVMGIVNIAVLARLLSPSDFGVVALAMIVIEFAQMLTEMQLASVLIRHHGEDEHLYSTAFTLAILRGVLTALGIVLCAAPAAALLGEPAVRDILFVLAIVPVIDGLRSPRIVEFARNVDFSRDALVTLSSRLVALIMMIVIAVVTRSHWALVAGTITASLVAATLTHIFRPFRPRLGLRDYQLFLGFGGWLSGAAVANYASSKTDALIVAGQFTAAKFGQYNLGMQIATMATSQLAEPFQRAIFSGLAATASDAQRRIAAYLKAQAAILGLLLPVGFGMVLVAHEVLMVIAGPKWLDSVIVIQFVAPTMAIATISAGAQALMMAEGDTKSIFWRNLTIFLVRVPLLWVAIKTGGMIGLLSAWAFSGFVYLYLTLRMVSSRHAIPLFAPFRLAWRSFAATGVMIACVLATDRLLPPEGIDFLRNLVHLGLKLAVGGVAYCGVHVVLWLRSGKPDGFEQFMLAHVRSVTARFGRIVRRA